MSLAEINKAILAEAIEESKAIKAEGDKKLELLKADQAKKLKARQDEIIAGAQRKAAQKIQQMQFKLQSQSQAEIHKHKNGIIDEAYKLAAKKLTELSETEYLDLMVKLLKEIETTDGEVISSEGKEKLLKKALQKADKNFRLIEKTVKDQGGFIYRSPKMEIDNTFSRLISDSRNQTILKVTKILFKAE